MAERFGVAVVPPLGARDATSRERGEVEFAPAAPPVVKPVDTTGAGDAPAEAFAATPDRGSESSTALAEGARARATARMHDGAQHDALAANTPATS